MIITFSVANFRSFAGEETFSLAADRRADADHPNHTIPIACLKQGALRAAVLYGANGGGKSNLFKALRYLKALVLETRAAKAGTERQASRFSDAPDEPSLFCLQFSSSHQLYRFSIKVDDGRILEERFTHVEDANERLIYQRTTSETGKMSVTGLSEPDAHLVALAKEKGRPNESFLATIHACVEAAHMSEELRQILHWFNKSLTLVGPDASFQRMGHLLVQDREFAQFMSDFLKSASTGVERLIPHKRVFESELKLLLGNTGAASLLQRLADEKVSGLWVPIGDGQELIVERKDDTRFYLVTIQAAHSGPSGKEVLLDLIEESDGTKRLLNLIPSLYKLRKSGGICFIDEIDRSLHPILVKEFLGFFLTSCEGRQNQIIVTTHEPDLLDMDLLRRDEIWFAEKDEGSATRLYSMVDFKVRNAEQVRKHYLQGRFGAVPFARQL